MPDLDDVDSLILNALRRNARISVSDLANEVGRSRTAVTARIARLEREGRILGYGITEPASPSDASFGAIIFVALKVRSDFDGFLSAAKKIPQIQSCTWIIGDHDFALVVRPGDKEELREVVERVFKIDGVKQTQTHMALHREF
ncbi:Lrp/AsnC family transcriptional regulator [Shimia sp. R10_1]|uniref:Lrp/AsnC family transcriptional regulator n=1 Tax=Shimia sp. R10_1 TaxID=2821095 RepID=UPI001ADD14D4|nr:Lrp/AsnC family transcriptional regulator [Shimia sp. R10_1]MBO9474767.1 Lrp/AsnC family transcriptional regulator [Shimia sp. R10_1]